MDHLRELAILGLRGFSTRQSLRLAIPNGSRGSGLTYLTGPNNSGKSTIVEAFRAYLWRQNRPSYHEGMRNRLTNSVRIEFIYDGRVDWIESLRPGGSETHSNFYPGVKTPYVVPSRRYFAPYFHRQAQIQDRSGFLLTSGDIGAQQPRGPSINQFEMRLFDIDRDDSKREAFNRILKRIVPNGVNWSIDQSESAQWVLRFLGDGKAHSAEGVGEGISSLFTLIAAFYDSVDGDMIIIDEPELSLHPAYQKRLCEVIADFAATRQIIISTHSPYLIDAASIRNGAELCRTWEREKGTEIYQLDSNAKRSWCKLTTRHIQNPHQFGLDAKEVFFLEDGVIVVEGQDDAILYPMLFEQVKADIKAEIYGWGAGGAHNIPFVLSILQALGYQKVAAIYDADKTAEACAVRADFSAYHVVAIPFKDVRDKKDKAGKITVFGMMDSSGQLKSGNEQQATALTEDLQACFA